MSLNGKRIGIDLDDLHEFGDRFRVPAYRQLTREVLEVVDRWAGFADEAGLEESHASRIAADLAAARPR